jgi:hypothetical protein
MSTASVTVVCEAGPAAGLRRTVPAGRYVVGRATSVAVRLVDPTVEPHHAVLDVSPDGAVRLVQVAGRVPCRIDGAPLSLDGAGAAVAPGAVVTIGSSRLRIGDGPLDEPSSGPPARPDRPTQDDHGDQHDQHDLHRDEVVVPSEPAPGARPERRRALVVTGALGAAAVVVAMRLGAPRATVGAVLLVVAAASAAPAARAVRRAAAERRASAQLLRRQVDSLHRQLVERRGDWLAVRRRRAPDLATVVEWLHAPAPLPGREDADGGMFVVSLGDGADRWEPALRTQGDRPVWSHARAELARLAPVERAPVEADLGPGGAVTVCGPGAGGVARAAVVQLAALVDADQLRIDAASDEPPAWVGVLPHAARAPASVAPGGDPRHVVAVVDGAELVGRTPADLRRMLHLDPSAALLIVDEHGRAAPSDGARLELGALGAGRWRPHPGLLAARSVHVAGLTETSALELALVVAERRPPILWPAPADLAELGGLSGGAGAPLDDPIEVAATWRTRSGEGEAWIGRGGTGRVGVEIGALTGPIVVLGDEGDTVRGAVATLVCSLAAQRPPEALTVVGVLAPGQHRSALPWAELPHVVRLVSSDDDDGLAGLTGDLFDAVATGGGGGGPDRTLLVVEDTPRPVRMLGPALRAVQTGGPTAGVHILMAASGDTSLLAQRALGDPGGVRIVTRLADVGAARRAVGDTRPLRLGPDGAIVARPGVPPRFVRLPVWGGHGWDQLATLVGAIRHAGALSASAPSS